MPIFLYAGGVDALASVLFLLKSIVFMVCENEYIKMSTPDYWADYPTVNEWGLQVWLTFGR